MTDTNPSIYPAENEWLMTGGLSNANAPIDTVTKILGRPDVTSNVTEDSTVAASSLQTLQNRTSSQSTESLNEASHLIMNIFEYYRTILLELLN